MRKLLGFVTFFSLLTGLVVAGCSSGSSGKLSPITPAAMVPIAASGLGATVPVVPLVTPPRVDLAWTDNSSDGSANVGHHDRQGGGPDPTSWNNAHPSRGCGQSDLQGTGGNGLFYCFAID